MNVNRGDRMDYLVSLESDQYNMEAYADWKTAKPLGIEGIDLAKFDFDCDRMHDSSGQMSVL